MSVSAEAQEVRSQADGSLRVVVLSAEPQQSAALTAALSDGTCTPHLAASLQGALDLYAHADADCLVADFALIEQLPAPDLRRLQRLGNYVPLLAVGPAISGATMRRHLRDYDIQGYLDLSDAQRVLATVDGWARRCRAWREAERRTGAHGRTLLESLSAAVIWIDADALVSEWNGASEKLFGLTRDAVIGTPFRSCPIKWTEPSVINRILAVAEGHQATRIDDIRFTRPDGHEGFLGMTVNVVTNLKGAAELLILGRDITPHKQQSAQVLQSQKLEAIGQLAAGVAHEINTPTQYVGDNLNFLRDGFAELTAVLRDCAALKPKFLAAGYTEAAAQLDAVLTATDIEYMLEQIPSAIAQSVEGNERVGQIVRAMKDFSHPGTVEKSSVDLNDGIRNTVTVSRNEWKYVAEIHLELDPHLPKVLALAGEINQVLLNIIVNAAHAIGDVVKGTEKRGSITLRTKTDGDWVLIQVSDTGGGIPERIRAKIFDPFFTTKEVGKGTGQGLAIARSVVVDKHGGTIDVDSTVGVGTTFTVRLPMERPTK
jgi:PAS domain S-box-containing protein